MGNQVDVMNTNKNERVISGSNNYHLSFDERDKLESEEKIDKIQKIYNEIAKYKAQISECIGALKILDMLDSQLPKEIIELQISVKKDCTLCLEKDTQLLENQKTISDIKKQKKEEQKSFEKKVSSYKTQITQLKQEAYFDSLTGLPNRRNFEKTLDMLIQNKEEFNVSEIDLDHFKNVNDTYGHLVGDQVLKFVASKLKLFGIAARWGGEEFLILSKCSENELKKKIEVLKNDVLSQKLILRNSKNKQAKINKYIVVKISAGVMKYNPKLSKEQFLEKVDFVMYHAKEERDCVKTHDEVKHILKASRNQKLSGDYPFEIDNNQS